MDITDFEPISEEKALTKKKAFKLLLEEDSDETYENKIGKILIGKSGVFYENKLFPDRDYTYSSNFNKKFLIDNEVKAMIERLKGLRREVNKDNSTFFYYGFMYKNGESYELSYNFNRDEKEELGELSEEIPETTKIKIYSEMETVFDNGLKEGIIVILRLPEKNIMITISHEQGRIITQL